MLLRTVVTGAAIANYVEVVSMTKDDATGLVNGVTAVDKLSGEKMNIRAKAVLMCGESAHLMQIRMVVSLKCI